MKNLKDELVLDLQKAHAGEWAAFLAYEGHWRSLKRSNAQASEVIQRIQKEEWFHRQTVGFMLIELGEGPNSVRDAAMGLVGRIASALCYVVPESWSGRGAKLIETIGKIEYRKMSKKAYQLGYFVMARELIRMAQTEEEHEKFFKK